MATETTNPAHFLGPEVIGKTFVKQYYQVLINTPEHAYKFYQDCSVLSRSDPSGIMTSATTLQAINETMLSLELKDHFLEIATADSQLSYQNGVFILVTGSLTGSDSMERKFTQSFFLAPQENGGYFVLNDVFRFMPAGQQMAAIQCVGNQEDEYVPKSPVVSGQDPLAAEVLEGDADCNKEAVCPAENGVSAAAEDNFVNASQDDTLSSQSDAPPPKADVPKKSYAYIVKEMKDIALPSPVSLSTKKDVSVPSIVAKTNDEKIEKTVSPSKAAHPPDTVVPDDKGVPKQQSTLEAPSYSIFIRNLPFDATAEEMEAEFTKHFGPVKHECVQVRCHKTDGFCYGFIEFESEESMDAAIKASHISLRGNKVYIDKKRTATRVVNGVVVRYGNNSYASRQFQSGRGGMRSESFRGRGGGYVGNNAGYGRNDFRPRNDFSGGGRGTPRPDSSYQPRVFRSRNDAGFGRLNDTRATSVSA